MQAEVLSVGTELLLGQTVNTDTTIVAKALSMLGIDLLYAAVVGDNVKRLEKAVHDALERSDILITTGGLGPTGDDLTHDGFSCHNLHLVAPLPGRETIFF